MALKWNGLKATTRHQRQQGPGWTGVERLQQALPDSEIEHDDEVIAPEAVGRETR